MNHGQESQGRIISIHAPQWGATIWFRWSNWITRISIHAPQWGATYLAVAVVVEQSISIHAPQWGATGAWRVHAQRGGISIHAPQWGATGGQNLLQNLPTLFQSTHPSGVRLSRSGRPRWLIQFQSTHPSGVRPDGVRAVAGQVEISIHAPQWGATRWGMCCPIAWGYFNPRTPVGCDSRAP